MAQFDPLHQLSSSSTLWSRSNLGEAMPGVPTPLTWTIRSRSENLGTRQAVVDLGAFAAGKANGDPLAPDTGTVAIFHGHPSLNVSNMLRVVAAMPGNSIAGAYQQLFGGQGAPPSDIVDTRRRYPVIAAKMPYHAAAVGRRLRAVEETTKRAWRRLLPASGDEPTVRLAFRQLSDLYTKVIRTQVLVIFLGQGCYQRLAELAQDAGRPGLEVHLCGGYGGVEETALAEGLWDVAQGRRAMAEFLAEFGHHGPAEGELSALSWREDATPLRLTLRTIATLAPERHPRRLEEAQRIERMSLQAELLAGLPGRRRVPARLTFALTGRFIPMRERGKSSMHRVLDLARGYARHAGLLLAQRGALADPSDVFYLTLEELLAPWRADYREAVEFRKERRAHYQTLSTPGEWIGMVRPSRREGRPIERASVLDGAVSAGSVLEGIGGSPGIAEGAARVVLDPAALTEPIEAGEILVCHTTDPSWVSLFLGADALVVDIGSVMSHAAIVARELGVPCVLNVHGGTTRIADGDRLRVDGDTGTVTILPG